MRIRVTSKNIADSAGMAVLFMVSLLFFCSAEVPAGDSESPDEIVSRVVTAYEKIDDYVCRFSQKELVNGKIREDKNLILKFKKPQHIYLRWTEGKDKGNEAIYVEGKNKNKLIVHLSGLWKFITVSLDPNNSRAMKNRRHPITDAGIGYVVKLMAENYSRAKNDKDCVISRAEDAEVSGRKAIMFNATFPQDKGYYNHMITIWIDRELSLPVKIVVHGKNKELLEEYVFDDIKIGTGLKDKDFDTKNPDYNF
jgi:outer membrane lipoprotein-sorting protein